MKKIILPLLVLTTTGTFAQKNPGFGKNGAQEICSQLSFSSDEQVSSLVNRILEYAGVENRSYEVRPCRDVSGCFATVIDDQQYIIYQPDYLKNVKTYGFTSTSLPTQQEDWQALTILAHEVGHLINAHFYRNRQDITPWDKELQADVFAGRIVYQMNGTLAQAQSVYKTSIVPEEGTMSHPGRKQRLEAVAKGYNNAAKMFPRITNNPSATEKIVTTDNRITSYNPAPVPVPKGIDGAVIDGYRETAEQLWREKKYKEAAAYYGKAITAGKNSKRTATDYLNKGFMYFLEVRTDKEAGTGGLAMEAFETVETKFNDPRGIYWEGRLWADADPKAATDNAVNRYLLWLGTDAVKSDNELIPAYQYLALYYYSKKDKANFDNYIHKADNIAPNDEYTRYLKNLGANITATTTTPNTENPSTADGYRKTAEQFKANKDYVQAAAWYDKTIKASNAPSAPDYFWLGYIYYISKELNKAATTFEKMEQAFPDQPSATYWRGRVAASVDSEATNGLAVPHYIKWLAIQQDGYEHKTADLKVAYQYLVVYYYNINDKNSLDKYIRKADEIIPGDNLIQQIKDTRK